MRDTLKTFLLQIPGFQALCRLLTRGHVRVFMYHRFATNGGDHPGWPDRGALRRQLEAVVRKHPVWNCERHLEHLRDPASKARGAVILTADDGYRDFFTHAFPVLTELGLPGTLFVTTGFVDGHTWMWWDKVAYICRETTVPRLDLVAGGREFSLAFDGDEARQSSFHLLADRCRFLPNREKLAVIADLTERARVEISATPPEGSRPVTWDEARQMRAAGMEILPHTDTHPILTRLDSEDARREITISQHRVTEELGDIPPVFCHPQGGPADFSDETCHVLEQCGVELCYLAYQDPEREANPRTMPRYCATSDQAAFQWQLCGAEYLMHRIRILRGIPHDAGRSYWHGAD